MGLQVKRGLFRASNGWLINADVNGALNLIRKVFPNAFAESFKAFMLSAAEGIEGGTVVRPLRINCYRNLHKVKTDFYIFL